MKYHLEKVLSKPGESLALESVVGPVADCIFHVHPEMELTLVEGSFGCRCIGAVTEPFSPGDLALIGGNVPHYYCNDPADSQGESWSRLAVIKFNAAAARPGVPEFGAIAELLTAAKAGGVVLARRSEELEARMRAVFAAEGMERMLGFWHLLHGFAIGEYRQVVAAVTPMRDGGDKRLTRVIQMVHKALESGAEISLESAAKAANMTPPAFSSYFHKAARKRFVDYCTELRLSRATGLLINSDCAVWEVANRSGYRNLSNFNRRFQEAYQLTPSEFRRKWRSLRTEQDA